MICSRFIHLHLPRTGGSLIRSCIQELVITPDLVEFVETGAHRNLRESRGYLEQAGHDPDLVPAFIFLRNPWSWYVSRWLRALSHHGFQGSFEAYMTMVFEQPSRYTLAGVFDWFTAGPGPITVLKYEHLVGCVVDLFVRYLPEVSEKDLLAKIHERGRVRASPSHSPYATFYAGNPGIVEQVYCHDEWLIKSFGYRFPPM